MAMEWSSRKIAPQRIKFYGWLLRIKLSKPLGPNEEHAGFIRLSAIIQPKLQQQLKWEPYTPAETVPRAGPKEKFNLFILGLLTFDDNLADIWRQPPSAHSVIVDCSSCVSIVPLLCDSCPIAVLRLFYYCVTVVTTWTSDVLYRTSCCQSLWSWLHYCFAGTQCAVVSRIPQSLQHFEKFTAFGLHKGLPQGWL